MPQVQRAGMLTRVPSLSWFAWDFPGFETEIPHPRNHLSPGQAGTVGGPNTQDRWLPSAGPAT